MSIIHKKKGYLTHLAGLSFAFGAFVAGMVLSESDYGHQALSDIIPLRDLFGLLFFTSVGMLFDPMFLFHNYSQVLFLVLAIGLGKGLIFAVISRIFKYRNVIPLAVGMSMFQIGEFSFVLAKVGVTTGSIGNNLYSLILTAAILTMLLTPLISSQTSRLYSLKKRWFRHEKLETSNIPETGFSAHVIIAGGGRVGFQIAQTLKRLRIHFIMIELDHRRFEQAKNAGMSVVYGDAVQEIVMEAAGIKNARLLILTLPGIVEARSVITHVLKLNRNIEIIARTSGPDYFEMLRKSGVAEVVLPEFEAGIEMTRQSLLRLRIAPAEVHRYTDALRNEIYAHLSGKTKDYQMLSQFRNAEQQFDLQWVHLAKNSPIAHKSIGESEIRKKTGVSLVGIVRDETLKPNPDAGFILLPGDMIAIIGDEKSRDDFFLMTSPS